MRTCQVFSHKEVADEMMIIVLHMKSKILLCP